MIVGLIIFVAGMVGFIQNNLDPLYLIAAGIGGWCMTYVAYTNTKRGEDKNGKEKEN